MKKPDRERQRRERRERNEANRRRNIAVGNLRVASVESLPALREPEIIDARPIRRRFNFLDWLTHASWLSR